MEIFPRVLLANESFWLFKERSREERSCLEYENVMRLFGTYEKSYERFSPTVPCSQASGLFLTILMNSNGKDRVRGQV